MLILDGAGVLGSAEKGLARAQKVFSSWSVEMTDNRGTLTHTQAVYREEEVVRKVNEGVWPVEAYHEYQFMVASSGNVDSAGLLLSYALDPAIRRFAAADSNEYPLHRAAVMCDTALVKEILFRGQDNPDTADDLNDMTPVMVASYVGCSAALSLLAAEGADLQLFARSGMNALMIAATVGHRHVIEALVRSGADVNARHRFAGTTALHMAAELNRSAAIMELCKQGADATLVTSLGSTALHVAASTNAFLSLDALVLSCHIDPNSLMNNDTTALYLAALNGYPIFADKLLHQGANVSYHMPAVENRGSKQLSNNHPGDVGLSLNSQPSNGAEAIHAAAENGHLDVIKILWKHGVDINTVSIGISPVYIAVQYNRIQVVKFLLEKGALVDKPSNIDGSTPLYFATGVKNFKLVDILIGAGASPLYNGPVGSFPLLYAAMLGYYNIVKRMLQFPNIDVNFSVVGSITALQAACSSGHAHVVALLLMKGSSLHISTYPDGDTPLHTAILSSHYEVITTIIEHMSTTLSYSDMRDFVRKKNEVHGCAALHYAVQRAPNSKSSDLILQLLEVGADVNATVSAGIFWGASSIYLAAASGNDVAIKILLNNGADPNIPLNISVGGYTPLIAAIDRDHADAVKALLEPKIDVIMTEPNLGVGTSWTQSPLLYAVYKGNSIIVDYLLTAGADCNIKIAIGRRGSDVTLSTESLLDLSRRRRHYDVMQVLKNHKACSTMAIE